MLFEMDFLIKDFFYDYLNDSEIMWDRTWFYRKKIKQGEWIKIDIHELNEEEKNILSEKLKSFFLIEYAYLRKYEEDLFRKKRIEKILGKALCEDSFHEYLMFEQELKKAVLSLV